MRPPRAARSRSRRSCRACAHARARRPGRACERRARVGHRPASASAFSLVSGSTEGGSVRARTPSAGGLPRTSSALSLRSSAYVGHRDAIGVLERAQLVAPRVHTLSVTFSTSSNKSGGHRTERNWCLPAASRAIALSARAAHPRSTAARPTPPPHPHLRARRACAAITARPCRSPSPRPRPRRLQRSRTGVRRRMTLGAWCTGARAPCTRRRRRARGRARDHRPAGARPSRRSRRRKQGWNRTQACL
jgi:hypothetical protein